MTLWQLLWHLVNLVLPALALALFMPLAGRWIMGRGGWPWGRRMAVHAGVGTLVLVLGLVLQGHDGRMSTYLVLMLVAATAEWAMHRGWRRT